MAKTKEYSKDIRKLAIMHYRDGQKASQIFDHLNKTVPVQTIRRWILEFKKNGVISFNLRVSFFVKIKKINVYF